MKKTILTFLFFISVNAVAQTQSMPKPVHYDFDWNANKSLTEITSASIKLVGSMIENRKTHDLFGFYCMEGTNPSSEPTCKKVRSVYFSREKNKLFAYGHVYNIQSLNPENPTDKEIKIAMKDLGKEFSQHWKRESGQDQRNVKLGMLTLPALWMGFPAVHAILFTGGMISCPITCPWVIAGSIIWIPTMIFLATREGGLLKNTGTVGSTISNHDGWDWTLKTKKIHNKKFRELVRYFDDESKTVPLAPNIIKP